MLNEAEAAKVVVSDALIDSICRVESNNNPNAVGDNGASVGIAQIQKICVDDVNRILGKKTYTYEDRKNVAKSKAMMKVYLQYYGARYKKLTGLEPTSYVLSRIWNGGPNGWKMKSTYAYMQKVKQYLTA